MRGCWVFLIRLYQKALSPLFRPLVGQPKLFRVPKQISIERYAFSRTVKVSKEYYAVILGRAVDQSHRSGYFILGRWNCPFRTGKIWEHYQTAFQLPIREFLQLDRQLQVCHNFADASGAGGLVSPFPKAVSQLPPDAKLSPLLAEIQEKYKKIIPQEYQQKTMELYQKHKVNPL